MPSAPSAFPLLGVPQAPWDKPNPPEGGKSLGEGPLRPKDKKKKKKLLAGQKAGKRYYLLPAPPNGQVWHKAFFMVGPGAGP